MAKKAPIDFSLLRTDFNEASRNVFQELNALLGQKSRTAEEIKRLEELSRSFLNFTKDAEKRDKAFAALFEGTEAEVLANLQHAIAAKVDVNLAVRTYSLLSTAATAEMPTCVEYLLSQNADPNFTPQHGFSPLQLAVIRDHAKIFNKLVKAGAIIDKADLVPLAKRNEANRILKLLEKVK